MAKKQRYNTKKTKALFDSGIAFYVESINKIIVVVDIDTDGTWLAVTDVKKRQYCDTKFTDLTYLGLVK